MKHTARKRFGQHFLADAGVIESILDAVDPRPGQALVEIGPGLGALTQPLRRRCGALTVIELDRDLAARLRREPGLTVVEADVLEVDFAALAAAAGQKLRVVGNLPYNISTPILFHLLGAPGCKDYGRLTVMLQWRYRIEPVLEVPPEAFEPPPRVHSAVVRMEPLPPPEGLDAARLGALVTVAFSQRRKLLRHTLGRWMEAEGVTLPFDLQRRAEEVPVAEYLALARAAPG